jgi:hypothetical protein
MRMTFPSLSTITSGPPWKQELQPLTVSVALLALADDLAIEHVERGEQRGRAIALVVVRHGGRTALLERQSRLRAIERLHLALLVAAQHLPDGRVMTYTFVSLLQLQ